MADKMETPSKREVEQLDRDLPDYSSVRLRKSNGRYGEDAKT